jgi:hypothetical protein
LLKKWVKAQTLSVVAVGDYKFDWAIKDGKHNSGYDEMTSAGAFTWVRPADLLSTFCNEPTGHQYPPAVMDFVFLGGPAAEWKAKSLTFRQ